MLCLSGVLSGIIARLKSRYGTNIDCSDCNIEPHSPCQLSILLINDIFSVSRMHQSTSGIAHTTVEVDQASPLPFGGSPDIHLDGNHHTV